jgi:hypothetical protein
MSSNNKIDPPFKNLGYTVIVVAIYYHLARKDLHQIRKHPSRYNRTAPVADVVSIRRRTSAKSALIPSCSGRIMQT